MGKVIDGVKIAKQLKIKLKEEIEELKEKSITVTLAVILVGNNPASKIYVKNKKKACYELGIVLKEFFFKENVSKKTILKTIDILNEDETINGILIQLPLPQHLNVNEVVNQIRCDKDVDCLNSYNIGRLSTGEFSFVPCTPFGVIELIKSTDIKIEGKNCVIVGRSNIVGKPLANIMLQKNATVTICHSKTKNLKLFTKNANILIVAVGKANFIGSEMVKENSIVIDVGINRDCDGRLCGDVNFLDVLNVANYITPVPGGVGPMTIVKLMENVIIAAKIQNKIYTKTYL